MTARPVVLAVFTLVWNIALGAQDKTLVELKARARADSNDPVAHFALAQGYLQAKQVDSARRSLETAILIDREFAPAYVLLGRIMTGLQASQPFVALRQADGRMRFVRLHGGTLDSAAALFRRAFLIDPLQEIYPATSFELPMVWRGTLEHGLREFRNNRLEHAAAIFDTVIMQSDRQHKPPPPVALWYHALSEVGIQQVDSAVNDMERLLDRALRDSTLFADYASRSVRYVLAFLHQRSGHYQEAERLYRQIVEEDVSMDFAHVQLAAIYELQQRWPEAVQERRNALMIASEDPTLLYDLGATLVEAGELAEAVDTLRRVTALDPRESRAYYMLGIAAARIGDSTAARAAYDRFLELAPSRYGEMIADAKARLARLP